MLVTLWNGEEFSKLLLACVAGGTYLLFARGNFWRRVAKYETVSLACRPSVSIAQAIPQATLVKSFAKVVYD